MPGLGQRCQGTGCSEGTEEERAGREQELSQALLAVFLPGSGNVAINTPVRREGTATPNQNTPFRSFPAGLLPPPSCLI